MRELQVRILPEVWQDLEEASAWYERAGGKVLRDRIIQAFRVQLDEIRLLAGSHRMVYKQFSRVFAKPFPYAIYFRIHEDWIVITLFWHTAKNPQVLKEKLQGRTRGG